MLEYKVPAGPGWIHELKWDGYRIIVRREGDRVHLWSRNGRNWADEFPRITEAIRALPFESFTLDGEAVCLLEDGRPDFHALRSKHTCRDAALIAFDLLGIDGSDLRPSRYVSDAGGWPCVWPYRNRCGRRIPAVLRWRFP